jgi:hypothetical protein
MPQDILNRRKFLQKTALLLTPSLFPLTRHVHAGESVRRRIVRVHSPLASRKWNYDTSAPWDHTVEPRDVGDMKSGKFRSDRYYDFINQDIVEKMLASGLAHITGTRTIRSAWKALLKDYVKNHRITIKVNLNNASYNEHVTTNRMDQSGRMINALVESLTTSLNIAEKNITVADPSRWIHPEIIIGRCPFKKIQWVDSRTQDLWDPGESVVFTRDKPARPGNRPDLPEKGVFHLARVYTEADHIINLTLFKNHACGVTGAMKNHFGAIPPPFPKFLHKGLGEKSYISDICNSPSIKNKVRLNICEAIFGNWHNNVWCPRPWKTFPDHTPNSIFLGTDPVAFDSVLLQHITDEIKAQGPGVARQVRDAVKNHRFLHYAMTYHKLGIHEHKPFSEIEYQQIGIS